MSYFNVLDALETYVSNIPQNQDEGTDDNEPIIKALNAFIASEGKGSESSNKAETWFRFRTNSTRY